MAVSKYPREAWQRLGRLLKSRRVHLDPRYKNRGEFSKATGLNYKLIQDLEGATRDTFTDESFALFETGYRLAAGSILRALAGADLEPAEREIPPPVPAAEAKAPAGETEEIDWETFTPQTPTEKALFDLYRASQRAMERHLNEITEKIDRLADRDDGDGKEERRLA